MRMEEIFVWNDILFFVFINIELVFVLFIYFNKDVVLVLVMIVFVVG